ncbi:hypothetical protein BLA60_01350 [Actinophytocola xinjiangensis]|uniref:Uncharacterized protein n=1 Tax=Actinophytocola xinjiangensis TaxID=485602 RepID=A0A7Z0WSE8_9PSEU|nr:hypothetical protein [Actinophytocola xinjiangensis]OLF13862.1 hypothetical protein BLA60_01350 [Actinophytocola xinjiangensis]
MRRIIMTVLTSTGAALAIIAGAGSASAQDAPDGMYSIIEDISENAGDAADQVATTFAEGIDFCQTAANTIGVPVTVNVGDCAGNGDTDQGDNDQGDD